MNFAIRRTVAAAALAIAGLAATPALAVVTFNDDVTNNVIFGTGNGNGFFTIDRNATSGIEVGLRAKLRGQGVYNSAGDGTYTFLKGGTASGIANWNFEYSVNSNFNGNGVNLDGVVIEMKIDFDPTAGVDTRTFDFYQVFSDNSHGTNATAQSGGAEAADFAGQDVLRANNNLVQNSQNMSWTDDHLNTLLGAGLSQFDPNATGSYDIMLSAFAIGGTALLASTSITVNVVPEPAALVLFGTALLGAGVLRRRRKA